MFQVKWPCKRLKVNAPRESKKPSQPHVEGSWEKRTTSHVEHKAQPYFGILVTAGLPHEDE